MNDVAHETAPKAVKTFSLGYIAEIFSCDQREAYDFLGEFIERIKSDCAAIDQSFESRNWQVLSDSAHGLAGCCSYIGAKPLLGACLQLEMQANEGQETMIKHAYSVFNQALAAFRVDFKMIEKP